MDVLGNLERHGFTLGSTREPRGRRPHDHTSRCISPFASACELVLAARFVAAFAVVLFPILDLRVPRKWSDDRPAADRLLGPGLLSKGFDELAGIGLLGVQLLLPALSGSRTCPGYLGPDGMGDDPPGLSRLALPRIYPVYLFALALSVAFHVLVGSPCTDTTCAGRDSSIVAISSVVLLQARLPVVGAAFNGPGWTLSVEALFYVCFPRSSSGSAAHGVAVPLALVVVLALVATQTGTVLASTVEPGSAARTWIQFSPVAAPAGVHPGDRCVVPAASPTVRLGGCATGTRTSSCWRGSCRSSSSEAGRPGPASTPIAVNLGLFDAWVPGAHHRPGHWSRLRHAAAGHAVRAGPRQSRNSLYILHWPLWFWFAWILGVGTAPSLMELVTYAVAVVVIAVVVCGCLERPARRRSWGAGGRRHQHRRRLTA